MKIVGMAGSNSKNSLNKKILETMKERYRDKFDLEIIDIGSLPFYNYDNDEDPQPSLVISMREEIKTADGIIFATPEYNHSIPAVLKNALDWFSRIDPVLQGKPSMIVGASPGMMGTARAQDHLRDILRSKFVGTLDLPGHEILIGSAFDKLDDNGRLVDEITLNFLDEAVEDFIRWIKLNK